MKWTWKKLMGAGGFAGVILLGCAVAAAQYPQSGQSQQSPPPPQQTDKNKQPTAAPLSLDAAATSAPVSAEEEAAYKAFFDAPLTDMNKKIQLGEDFAGKYPHSRYISSVYSVLVSAYFNTGQVEKMYETGEKEIAMNPNDVQVLAVVGQTLPRAFNPSAPDAAKRLDKAEEYSKRAIELVPTLTKPANLTDEGFANAKNVALAMAHSGLGLVYVRRGKFADAIPELEQSLKVDPNPDPVNYYLLGLADLKTSHFEDAVTAYTKCAAMAGSMQQTCKNGVEEAKKQAATQLSAPK